MSLMGHGTEYLTTLIIRINLILIKRLNFTKTIQFHKFEIWITFVMLFNTVLISCSNIQLSAIILFH
jgi:hypothetical protein